MFEVSEDTTIVVVPARAESDRRLLVLADFLEGLPDHRFDYTIWVGIDWKGEPDLSCGTTACALGWATAIPEFQALGLKLHRGDPLDFADVRLGELGPTNEGAAVLVFGISDDEAEFLFQHNRLAPDDWFEAGTDLMRSPRGTADAKEVAEHIRAFVRERNRLFPSEGVSA